MAKVRKLTEQEIQWLLDDTLHCRQIDQTLKKFGPEWDRSMLNQCYKENPELKQMVDQAELDAVHFMENDFLNVHRNPLISSKEQAAQYSNNLKTILAARKPEKYGNKIDLNVNAQISIKGNIEKANERLSQVIRDVTPALIVAAVKDKKE